MIQEAEVQCPYCWETIAIELDLSADSQDYTEDCSVCCQPIRVRIRVDGNGGYTVDAEREND